MFSMSELPDDKLIYEGYSKNPYPFWIWVLGIVLFGIFAWLVKDKVIEYVPMICEKCPFAKPGIGK
jgi:hypothetical protein